MKNAQASAAALLTIAFAAACGGGSESTGSPSDDGTTRAASASAEEKTEAQDVIPDGTYFRTASSVQARRLGLPKDIASDLGEDGRLDLELRISGVTFVHLVEEDGAMVVGDQGTAAYDRDGNWVLTSDSSGCPGCTATLAWSVEGDRLTLRFIDGTGESDPVDAAIGRLVLEGRWIRR